MTARRWALLVVVAIALLLVVGRVLAGVYVDYRWYSALGAASLWRTRALLSGALYLASGGAAALFIFANLYAVRHSVVSIVLPRRVANVEIGQEVPGRYLVIGAAIIAILAGMLLTLPSDSWQWLALSRNGVPFGETDPYFEVDLGFFVYWLPFESALHIWALITALVAAALVIFLYALTPSMRWERGSVHVSNWVRRHLVVLGSLMLMLLAWGDRLHAFKVMVHGSGAGGAFTFSDHHAAIPVSIWLSIITVGIAFVVLFFGWNGQLRVAFVALSALLVLSFGLRQLGPTVARRSSGVEDAAGREEPYRQLRAGYTRRAYALDHVEAGWESAGGPREGFASEDDLTGDVSVWDPAVLSRAVAVVERTAGAPHGVAWLPSSASLQAALLTEPERGAVGGSGPAPETPAGRRGWLVTRVLASANDGRGHPIIVPQTRTGPSAPTDTLHTVLVYDSVPGYTVVADPLGQVAAPGLSSRFSRLAHAWGLQNFRLLSGDLARARARVVIRRGVRERVRALAPFFAQGRSVHPVVALDSLYWVVELYAASDLYPLSEHSMLENHDYSYVRYAGAAVVNSHTGWVSFVPEPVPGPIARSWQQLFPLLLASSPPPAQVVAAIPPAVDGARIQAEKFARFAGSGKTQPMGHLPWNEGADSVLRADVVPPFQLPGGTLAWSQPVLDSADRVTGVIVRSAGSYPATHWIAYDGAPVRWTALVEHLHRALDTAVVLPTDTRLVRGPARAFPLRGGAIALVQPAYRWKTGEPPALARVAVVRDTVATAGVSLAEALGIASQPSPDTGAPAGGGDFRARVRRLYEAMRDALRRGDWDAFGRAYEALGKLAAPETP